VEICDFRKNLLLCMFFALRAISGAHGSDLLKNVESAGLSTYEIAGIARIPAYELRTGKGCCIAFGGRPSRLRWGRRASAAHRTIKPT